MGSELNPPRSERIAEFLRRLAAAPAANNAADAYRLLCDTLNEVEDQLTSIPFDLSNSDTDGRLYPPLADNIRAVPNYSLVKRYRHRAHNTYIGENGSIEIRPVPDGPPLLSKAGNDGRGVWEL